MKIVTDLIEIPLKFAEELFKNGWFTIIIIGLVVGLIYLVVKIL